MTAGEEDVMAVEVTVGGESTLEARDRMRLQPLPLLERFTGDFTDHDAAAGQPGDGSGIAWFWEQFGKAFSDVEREDVETIATPTKVITISTLAGTHTGEWMGHPPTGRRFTGIRNVQVIGFRNGRASERWGSTDQLGMLQQLGLACRE
jgi:predicted ester cyclase